MYTLSTFVDVQVTFTVCPTKSVSPPFGEVMVTVGAAYAVDANPTNERIPTTNNNNFFMSKIN